MPELSKGGRRKKPLSIQSPSLSVSHILTRSCSHIPTRYPKKDTKKSLQLTCAKYTLPKKSWR